MKAISRFFFFFLSSVVWVPHVVSAQPIFERHNTSSCGVTTASVFRMTKADFISEVTVWARWNSGETTLEARIYDQAGNVAASGPATRGTCDSNQSSWCEAILTVNTDWKAGLYTVSIDEPRICITAGIESGFVRVYGRKESVTSPPPASAAANVDWSTTVLTLGYRGNNSERYHVICPSGNSASVGGVWGTSTYTDDSSICSAAVHAGVIGFSGGQVTFEIRPGQSSYEASNQNGVQTTAFGSWEGSFGFPDGASARAPGVSQPQVAEAISAEMTAVGLSLRGKNGSTFRYSCPAGSASANGNIWGTDVYTDDSSICKAAVHAGVISSSGGTVTIEILAGRTSYRNSDRYGISSTAFGEWTGSFRFVR
jgi:hypothetical protein